MREVAKKDAPAISGGYTGTDSVIPVRVPIEEFPTNPAPPPSEDDLPTGYEPTGR